MQPFHFSDSFDKNRSGGASLEGASFISPSASVDDTSFAMEVDCSFDMSTPAKGMTVVTPKAPAPLPQSAVPTQVFGSPSAVAVAVSSVLVPAAPVTSITDTSVAALQQTNKDKADTLCVKPDAVSSAPVLSAAPVSVVVEPAVEVPVVPCGVQIATTLQSLQTVLEPLIHLVGTDAIHSTNSSKANNSPNTSNTSDAPSLASSITVDPFYRTTTTTSSSSRGKHSDKMTTLGTEPPADNAMQTKKLQYLDKILFPSLHSDTKAAELSQNGEVLFIIEQILRYVILMLWCDTVMFVCCSVVVLYTPQTKVLKGCFSTA